ncbi:Lipid A core - O-antigen ligase and related enzymes [[Actinobacillus] rossii]|uniref:Lipid A core - O-antigen ligase and related enzymes n=1 Tax=[Actinobacillus] rossii TaxID=123820 RepID=A0A380TR58_9PAST|nr:Lipid A core - O-antigen ligase and related enzymes [[Actinobacillus] rossii]
MTKLKSIKGNQHLANYFYLVSFCFYLINTFLNHSMFAQLSSYFLIKVLLFSAVILFLLLKIILIDSFSYKELIVYFSLALLICVISLKSGDQQLITLIALILGAKNVNFKYVLISFLISIIFLLVFTYISTLIDIIPNLQYSRIRDGELKVRNSFGTSYPTVFAAYLQSIVIVYAYLMKPNKLINHVLLLLLAFVCSYLVLTFADARMSGYSIFLFLLIYYFCICFFRKIYKHKLIILLISLTYLLGFIMIFYLSYGYSPENEIFVQINKALSGRLALGYKAFQEYSIPFLGQKVEFIGLGGAVQEMSEDYNYVDSSYLQFMMKYGIVFTTISIASFIKLTYKRLKLNDYRFIAVIFMLSFSSMIEDRLLDISINVYWILMLAYYNNFKLPINYAKN